MKVLLTIALGWAVLVFTVYVIGITTISPFNDWKADNKLSLLQSAVGLAGFGAGSVLLFVAAREFSKSSQSPYLYLRDFPTILDESNGTQPVVPVILVNAGAVLCAGWHVRVRLGYLVLPSPADTRIAELNAPSNVESELDDGGQALRLSGTWPIFPGESFEIGSFLLQVPSVRQKEIDLWMSAHFSWDGGSSGEPHPYLLKFAPTLGKET